MASLYSNEIGQFLRQAREELGLTSLEASAALHIRAHYLEALETGDLSVLPGITYTKGYLQSYAVFLRLDKDEILRRFERVENYLPQRGLFLPQAFSSEKSPSHKIVWGGVAVALFAYMFWYFMFKPDTDDIALISPPMVSPENMEYNISGSVFNLPCLMPPNTSYPPCYRVTKIEKTLLPLHRKIKY